MIFSPLKLSKLWNPSLHLWMLANINESRVLFESVNNFKSTFAPFFHIWRIPTWASWCYELPLDWNTRCCPVSWSTWTRSHQRCTGWNPPWSGCEWPLGRPALLRRQQRNNPEREKKRHGKSSPDNVVILSTFISELQRYTGTLNCIYKICRYILFGNKNITGKYWNGFNFSLIF